MRVGVGVALVGDSGGRHVSQSVCTQQQRKVNTGGEKVEEVSQEEDIYVYPCVCLPVCLFCVDPYCIAGF